MEGGIHPPRVSAGSFALRGRNVFPTAKGGSYRLPASPDDDLSPFVARRAPRLPARRSDQIPRLARLAPEELLRLVVADDLFLIRVPPQLSPADAVGNVPEVADDRRLVADLHL